MALSNRNQRLEGSPVAIGAAALLSGLLCFWGWPGGRWIGPMWLVGVKLEWGKRWKYWDYYSWQQFFLLYCAFLVFLYLKFPSARGFLRAILPREFTERLVPALAWLGILGGPISVFVCHLLVEPEAGYKLRWAGVALLPCAALIFAVARIPLPGRSVAISKTS